MQEAISHRGINTLSMWTTSLVCVLVIYCKRINYKRELRTNGKWDLESWVENKKSALQANLQAKENELYSLHGWESVKVFKPHSSWYITLWQRADESMLIKAWRIDGSEEKRWMWGGNGNGKETFAMGQMKDNEILLRQS